MKTANQQHIDYLNKVYNDWELLSGVVSVRRLWNVLWKHRRSLSLEQQMHIAPMEKCKIVRYFSTEHGNIFTFRNGKKIVVPNSNFRNLFNIKKALENETEV